MSFESVKTRLLVGGVIDGCLTATGIAFGAAFATADTRLVVIVILSAAFSNVIASTFATVTGELAEVASWSRILGRKMRLARDKVSSLSVVKEFRREALTNWVVGGVGIVSGSTLPALPFFFFHAREAIGITAVISAAILFGIGGFIGRLNEENIIKSGLMVLAVGTVTAAITYSIQFLVEHI